MSRRAERARRVVGGLLILWIAAAARIPFEEDAVRAQDRPCLAATANGTVAGSSQGRVCTYLGIPFAAPPVGNLRWRPPQPRSPWAPATLNATAPAPACAQINPANALAGNEDCLTLNVWAPTASPPGRGYPVLVWIHAGAFLGASSNFAPNDGRRFAEERSAVVVAPNYRLGAFGWLAHPALTDEDANYPSSGNYGLADQRAALRWVRDNIAAFGGDPGLVTVAGSSAGGVSSGLHLVSPASRGLFERAIIQSGFASVRAPSIDEAHAQGEAFATALGCTSPVTVASCLRSKSRDQVLTALPLSTLPGGFQQFTEDPGKVVWGPIVDGLEIPDQPRELYRRGNSARVPIIVGAASDDGWLFVDRSFPAGVDSLQFERALQREFGMDAEAIGQLYPLTAFPTPKDALARVTTDAEFVCEARRTARALNDNGAPVYFYSFEYPVDEVNPRRAIHGLEVSLLFGNNFAAPSNHVLTPADLVIFDTMSTFWRRFMETGDPNPRGVPDQWPPYRPGPYDEPVDPSRSDHYYAFGERLGTSTYLHDPQCNFWEAFFFRSVLGALPAAAR